jgi:hypothetical protein
MSDQFTINWWEHLFNHTAKKIDKKLENKEDAVKESETIVNKDDLNNEAASSKLEQRKSFFYARFQKGNLLVNGELQKDPKQVDKEEEEKKVKKDEDTYDKKGKKM